MRITAAIARSARAHFALETVEIDEPQGAEILVRVEAAGLSHIDLLARDQRLPVRFPAVFGREAAGVVERVGPAATRLQPGDRVVLTYRGGGLEAEGADLLGLNLLGQRSGGAPPLRCDGEQIAGWFFGQSSLATHALASEENAVKIDGGNLSAAVLAPLGGDGQTGAGAVINTLRPQPGSAIAIFGAGAVGLSAVMAAQLAGCHPIVAVDIKASRLQLAEGLGASHTIDPDWVDAVESIRAISGDGAAFSVETTGLPGVVRQAVECLAPTGACALAGLAAADAEASLNLNRLRLGRTLCGSAFGAGVPGRFVPRLVELCRQQRFPVERIVTEYRFEEINRAADDLLSGAAVKAILVMR